MPARQPSGRPSVHQRKSQMPASRDGSGSDSPRPGNSVVRTHAALTDTSTSGGGGRDRGRAELVGRGQLCLK
jgi:hypothetical protein